MNYPARYEIMNHNNIRLDVADALRCSFCNEFLSCGPVYVVNEQSSSCGRCKEFTTKQYINNSYQYLAQFFYFPCYNWTKHCSQFLKWDEALTHESQCKYSGCMKTCCKSPRSLKDFVSDKSPLIGLTEKDISNLICLSCEGPLSACPVIITSDGYDVCHRCADRRSIEVSKRNMAYEIIATLFLFPCRFRNKGCPKRLYFGNDVLKHEAECVYGRPLRSSEEQYADGKVKGVLKTHTGHIFGTIPSHNPAFAPPPARNKNGGFDMNKELVKSLHKKQNKQRGALPYDEGSDSGSDGRTTPKADSTILNARALDEQFTKQSHQIRGYQNSAYEHEQQQQRQYQQQQYQQQQYQQQQYQQQQYQQQQYQQQQQWYRGQNQRPSYNGPVQYSQSDVNHMRHQNMLPRHLQSSQSFNHGRPNYEYGGPRVHRQPSISEAPTYLNELKKRQVERNNSLVNKPQNPYFNCNNLNDLCEAYSRLGVPAGVYS